MRLSDKAVKVLRWSSLLVGLVLIAVSLSAESLGLSAPGGFSRNQALAALAGAALLACAILGRKTVVIYRKLGLILVNAIVVFLILEFLGLLVVKSLLMREEESGAPERKAMGESPPSVYEPYVVWIADPASTRGETVDSDGLRMTPGSSGAPDAYRVFIFGGSTVWGCGTPDSSTIPARFLDMAVSQCGMPVNVTNFGQIGYVSTQEVISLYLEIRDGNVPDLVIFIDGFNDAVAAYQSGVAGYHHNFPTIRDRFEQRGEGGAAHGGGPPALQLIRETNTYLAFSLLLETVAPRTDARPGPMSGMPLTVDPDSIALEVTEVMLGNYSFVRELSEAYGFDAFFFLQPTIWSGDKPLSESEMMIVNGVSMLPEFGGDDRFMELLGSTYEFLEDSFASYDDSYSLTGVFDEMSELAYTDFVGVHLSEAGNRLVAEALMSRVRDLLPSQDTPEPAE